MAKPKAAPAKKPSRTRRTPKASEVLKPQQWLNEPVAVIGGGPSLRGFDPSLLNGIHKIACNGAYQLTPDADIVIGIDWRFFELVIDRDDWKDCKAIKLMHQCCTQYPRHVDVEGYELPVARSSVPWGAEFEEGIAASSNTGAAAVNLADMLGADPILLFGFDMKGENGKLANFHELYPKGWMKAPETVYDRFLRSFERVMRYCHSRIINCNPESNLQLFPQCSPEEGLAIARKERSFDDVFPNAELLGAYAGPYAVRTRADRGSPELVSSAPCGRSRYVKGTSEGRRKIPVEPPKSKNRPSVASSLVDREVEDLIATPSNINEHLATLRELARDLDVVAEFGSGTSCRSTRAFIAGRPKKVLSYDIRLPSQSTLGRVGQLAFDADVELFFFEQDTSTGSPLEESVDLLFVDSLHNFDQVTAELSRCEPHVRKYLVFHDVISYGLRDEKPRPVDRGGILPAILLFLRDYPWWKVNDIWTNGQGLLILERVEDDYA